MCVELGDSFEIRWLLAMLCPHCLHIEGCFNVRRLHDTDGGQHDHRERNKTIINAKVPIKFHSNEQTGSEKNRGDGE